MDFLSVSEENQNEDEIYHLHTQNNPLILDHTIDFPKNGNANLKHFHLCIKQYMYNNQSNSFFNTHITTRNYAIRSILKLIIHSNFSNVNDLGTKVSSIPFPSTLHPHSGSDHPSRQGYKKFPSILETFLNPHFHNNTESDVYITKQLDPQMTKRLTLCIQSNGANRIYNIFTNENIHFDIIKSTTKTESMKIMITY